MERLPQDILDEIVSYLLPEDYFEDRNPYEAIKLALTPLTPLAIISRRLRDAVEKHTFRSIRITSTELGKFKELLTPSRRFHLRELTFTAILPSYDDEAAARAESPAERTANDESYTSAIRALFETLKSWEDEDPGLAIPRMRLLLNQPESPSDQPWPLSRFEPWSDCVLPEVTGISEGRYLHSYIDLLHPEAVPSLQAIKGLVMGRPEMRYAHRNIIPKVHIILASKLPNLRVVCLDANDDECRFPEMRRKHREDMADAIRQLSLSDLKSVKLDFFHRNYLDEHAMPPLLHDRSLSDPLSTSICELSQNLVSLEVDGVFDVSLLRPLNDLGRTPWPRLKFFFIDLRLTTPSGEWYFEGDCLSSVDKPVKPGRGHPELHEEKFSFLQEADYAHIREPDTFRSVVSEKSLGPLLDAFADALCAMPVLRAGVLSSDITYQEEPGTETCFGIAYFAPCASAKKHPPKNICPKCRRNETRQLATSFLGWTPPEELMTKLRSIQQTTHRVPIVERDIGDIVEDLE